MYRYQCQYVLQDPAEKEPKVCSNIDVPQREAWKKTQMVLFLWRSTSDKKVQSHSLRPKTNLYESTRDSFLFDWVVPPKSVVRNLRHHGKHLVLAHPKNIERSLPKWTSDFDAMIVKNKRKTHPWNHLWLRIPGSFSRLGIRKKKRRTPRIPDNDLLFFCFFFFLPVGSDRCPLFCRKNLVPKNWIPWPYDAVPLGYAGMGGVHDFSPQAPWQNLPLIGR